MRSLFYPLGGFHMILNVAICDDEENDIDIISDYLFKYQMINIQYLIQLENSWMMKEETCLGHICH